LPRVRIAFAEPARRNRLHPRPMAHCPNLRALRRQRRNRLASLLKSGFVRPPIGEPLSNNSSCQFFGAFHIVHAERNAVAKANIELGNVAVQMFLAERTSE